MIRIPPPNLDLTHETFRDQTTTLRDVLILAGVFVATCIFFTAMGFYRLLDGDEAFFLLAAKFVLQGKTPYVDFFFMHMPLLPYLYAAWFKVFGTTLLSGRLLSVFLCSLTCATLGFVAWNATRKTWLAAGAMLLFAGTSGVFGWFILAKTYAPSMLLIVVAYALWIGERPRREGVRYGLAGLCLGLTVSTRVMFLPLIAFFVLDAVFSRQSAKEKTRILLYALLGFIVGLAPVFYFLCYAPDFFYFNTVTYHVIGRSNHGFIGDFQQKAQTLTTLTLGMFGAAREESVNSLQFMLLFVPSVFFVVRCFLRKSLRALDAMFLGFFGLSILPTPAFVQYFYTAAPFLALNVVFWFADLNTRVRQQTQQRIPLLFISFSLLYAAIGAADIARYTSVDQAVPGMEWIGEKRGWSMETVRDVGRAIDRYEQAGYRVVTWWPAYYVEASSTPFPRLENHFGHQAASHLDERDQERFKVVTVNEIGRFICHNDMVVVVLDPWSLTALKQYKYSEQLASCGYSPVENINGTLILSRQR